MKMHIIGRPSYKQSPADSQERVKQNRYIEALRTEAVKKIKSPIDDDVKLTIRYSRKSGRADPANIIGGISDTLQKIAFHNDNQIKELHYFEKTGNRDEYWIEIL